MRKYIYKAYQDNQFIDVLPAPSNDFEYTLDINSPGTEVTVEVPVSFDEAGADVVSDVLIDSSGQDILDNFDKQIIADRYYTFTNVPMQLANRIEVWCYYDNAVNGIRVFNGIITTWSYDYLEAAFTLSLQSQTVELDNHLIETSAGAVIVSFSEPNGETTLVSATKLSDADSKIAQTFQLGVQASVKGINIPIHRTTGSPFSIPCTLRLVQGTPTSPGPVLATVTREIFNDTTQNIPFTFAGAVTLAAVTDYYVEIINADFNSIYSLYVGSSSVGGYASGQLYTWGGSSYSGSSTDACFEVVSEASAGTIGASFSSLDPSAILRTLIGGYQSLGGSLGYTDASIDDTGTLVSYNFGFDTYLDGIKKVLELAPSNWYWYIDQGENILHFHRQSFLSDHIFTKGVELENLVLAQTLETVKNDGYFTGGDTGSGINLLEHKSIPSSIGRYGTWLDKKQDNRVTRVDTATIILNSGLRQYNQPSFRTKVTILAGIYDIETIKPGQMVSFRNFDNLIDSLLLHIVSIAKTPDKVTLSLDTALPALPHRVEDIKRNLDQLYTVNNPTSIS